MAESSNAGENGIGAFGPDERRRFGIGLVDVGPDGVLKISQGDGQRAWGEVVPFYTFPDEVRKGLHNLN